MTQGRNGGTSHKSSNGLYYAIDVANGSQPVYAASDGYASCTAVFAQASGEKQGTQARLT